jgi:imidazolonepropionase-like amidohydrolase
MAKNGVTYDPTLSVGEAFPQYAAGKLDLLNRSLVQQVVPKELLAGTKKMIESPEAVASRKSIGEYPVDMAIARDNLLRAWKAGVTLITGTDAGNMLVFHGPTVQHELELWVEAGIPTQVALQAATLNSAKALGAGQRFGSIEKGKDATMLIVDGNPLLDIKATEAISTVMFKGEKVDRAGLFDQD